MKIDSILDTKIRVEGSRSQSPSLGGDGRWSARRLSHRAPQRYENRQSVGTSRVDHLQRAHVRARVRYVGTSLSMSFGPTPLIRRRVTVSRAENSSVFGLLEETKLTMQLHKMHIHPTSFSLSHSSRRRPRETAISPILRVSFLPVPEKNPKAIFSCSHLRLE